MTFKPNWKIALFTFSLLPLLLLLGFWQLDREEEKIAMQEAHGRSQLADPVSLPASGKLTNYQRVTMIGEFDNERTFLLDNRIHEGVVGYEVIQPFHYEEGTVLVNRGWLPLGQRRDDLPEIPRVQGNVRLTGSVYIPAGTPFLLGEPENSAEWPRVIQTVDLPEMARVLDIPVFPQLIRLAEDSAGILVPNWPLVNMEPAKHRAYAVQWFTMAAVLLMLFLYTAFRRSGNTPSRNGSSPPTSTGD